MNQKSALLVIDAQIGPMYGTQKKEETIGVINTVIARAEAENVPVFYIQHEEIDGMLKRGTPFWQFEPGISPKANDIIIHKQSADSFFETNLFEELNQLEINHLVVTGARTEYCVDTTCRRAISIGFDVSLVEDGHTTADGVIPADQIIKHHNHNLSTVRTTKNKIEVIPSSNISFKGDVQTKGSHC